MKQSPIEKEGISLAEPLSAQIVEKKSFRISISLVEQKYFGKIERIGSYFVSL